MRSKKHGEGRQIIFDHSKHLAIKRSKLRWLMLFILHRVVLLRCAVAPRTTARKSWSMSSLQIGQGMVLWLLEYLKKKIGELQEPPAVLPGELGVPPIPNRERRSITLIWQPMVQNTVVCSIVVVLCEHCFCGGFH